MSTGPRRVGSEEFYRDLMHHLEAPSPVAVTRHGRTLGYYIPVPPPYDGQDPHSITRAGMKMERLLAECGATEDDIVGEFDELRHY